MYKVVSLTNLIEALDKEELEKIILSFKSNSAHPNDIEIFLHKKAIQFERAAIASTYLVFERETNILVGFFSLANKPLTNVKEKF